MSVRSGSNSRRNAVKQPPKPGDMSQSIDEGSRCLLDCGLDPKAMTSVEKSLFQCDAWEYLEARNTIVKLWHGNITNVLLIDDVLSKVDAQKRDLFKQVFYFLQESGAINWGKLPTLSPEAAADLSQLQRQPTKRELLQQLYQLLLKCDISSTSEKQIRLTLEQHFNVPLTEYKGFLRQRVMRYINVLSQQDNLFDPVTEAAQDPDVLAAEVKEQADDDPHPCGKVVVIGAGPAGLAAATVLKRNGVEVVVLEAQDRVGGRVYTFKGPFSAPVDLGASLITGTEADVAKGHSPDPCTIVCRQLGLRLHPLKDAMPIFDAVTGAELPKDVDDMAHRLFDGLLDTAMHRSSRLSTRTESLGDAMTEAWQRMEVAATDDSRDRQQDSGGRHNGCDIDCHQTSSTQARSRALHWHCAHLEYGCSAPLTAVSRLHWNQDESCGAPFGGPHCMVVGGYGQVTTALAEGLDVRLQTPATEIAYNDRDVHVTTAAGETFTCDAAVVTLPLGVLKAGAVTFSPPLPAWKAEAIQRLGFGNLNKVVLEFNAQFWPDVDYFGVAQSTCPRTRGLCFMFWNLLPSCGAPILVALVSGEAAHQCEESNTQQMVEAALAALTRVFGEVVTQPCATHVTQWKSDPHVQGSYSYVAVGATGEEYDILARPVQGRVMFAGEHTCRQHPDTVGGAILTGMREAHRAIRLLRGLPEVQEDPGVCTEEHLVSHKRADAPAVQQRNIPRRSDKLVTSKQKRVPKQVSQSQASLGTSDNDPGNAQGSGDAHATPEDERQKHTQARSTALFEARSKREQRQRADEIKGQLVQLSRALTTAEAGDTRQLEQALGNAASSMPLRQQVLQVLQAAPPMARRHMAGSSPALQAWASWLAALRDEAADPKAVKQSQELMRMLQRLPCTLPLLKQSGLAQELRKCAAEHPDKYLRVLATEVMQAWVQKAQIPPRSTSLQPGGALFSEPGGGSSPSHGIPSVQLASDERDDLSGQAATVKAHFDEQMMALQQQAQDAAAELQLLQTQAPMSEPSLPSLDSFKCFKKQKRPSENNAKHKQIKRAKRSHDQGIGVDVQGPSADPTEGMTGEAQQRHNLRAAVEKLVYRELHAARAKNLITKADSVELLEKATNKVLSTAEPSIMPSTFLTDKRRAKIKALVDKYVEQRQKGGSAAK